MANVIFIRTDFPTYEEETIQVQNLADLLKVCSENRLHRLLDRVLVFSRNESHSQALVLEFVSVSETH